MRSQTPPPLTRTLLRLSVRGEAYEVIAGDLDEEFAGALAAGVPMADARRQWRRQALRSIVSVVSARAHDALRSSGGPSLSRVPRALVDLGRDARYVARQLRRSPSYAATAVLSLALGIGGGTAVYGVLYRVLIQPLPVEHPEEIAVAYWGDRAHEPPHTTNVGALNFRATDSGIDYSSNYSYPEYARLAGAAPDSASICAFATPPELTIARDGQPAIAAAALLVSGTFFTTLRPQLALGRALDSRDDAIGAVPAAVLSHRAWVRIFGADAHALGSVVRVDTTPVVIVGILDSSFEQIFRQGSSSAPDVILALAEQPAIAPAWNRYAGNQSLFVATNVKWLRVLVRTDPRNRDRLAETFTDTYRLALIEANRMDADTARAVRVRVIGAERGLEPIPNGAERPLLILACVVAIVLVITCLNIAGLMLTRDLARRREFAVRRALGASPWRLARERLVESAFLSATGAIAGVLVARWFAPLVLRLMAKAPDSTGDAGLTANGAVLIFMIAASTLASLVAGSVPALALAMRGADDRSIGRTASTRAPRFRTGRVLLAIQIAAAVPLIVAAGLFLRTLRNLTSVNLGFDPQGLVIVSVDPRRGDRSDAQVSAIYARLLDRVSAVPGVASATLVENVLLSGATDNFTATIDGTPARIWGNTVGPGYFETLAIPLRAGRTFDVHDDGSSPAVAIINEAAARLYFGGASPLGRQITLTFPQPHSIAVIGVVADSKYESLKAPIRPTMFQSYRQSPSGRMRILLRATVPAVALETPIVNAVAEVDRDLPVTAIKTQVDQIGDTISRERLMAAAVTSFSGVVLALVCVGLYGVTSYLAGQRTNEIGVRIALGARRSQVVWLIVRQMSVTTAAGLGAGLLIAWGTAPVVGTMLYGLAARDLATLGLAALVIAIAILGATLKPARQASRVDPLVSLRTD